MLHEYRHGGVSELAVVPTSNDSLTSAMLLKVTCNKPSGIISVLVSVCVSLTENLNIWKLLSVLIDT